MNIGSVPTNTGVNAPIQSPRQPTGPDQRPPHESVVGQIQNGQGAIAGYAQSGSETTLEVRGTEATVKGKDAPTQIQDPNKVTGEKDKEKNKEIKKEDVEKAVSSVNDYIDKLRHRELQFTLDDESGKVVIKIMDTDTKKVIRQIPPEEMLRLAENIGKDRGWLVEQQA